MGGRYTGGMGGSCRATGTGWLGTARGYRSGS